MNKRSDRILTMGLAIVASIFMAGSRSNCTTQPATLDCSSVQLNVNVQRGNCGQFNNACADQLWVTGDNFELDTTPSGVTITASGGTSPTRTLCVASAAPLLNNQPLSYTYSRNGAWGQGTMFLTTGVPLNVSASAAPNGTVVPGTTVQLNANLTGGVGPYSFVWTPAAGLSPSNTSQNPTVVMASSATFTVTVTDSQNASASSSVTINVDAQVSASANPTPINPGQSSQLLATVNGGTPPFSYVWSPAASLTSATISNPVASPTVTTAYTVTVTDATGFIASASVTVRVNLIVTVTATPPTIGAGSGSTLAAIVQGGTPPYTYTWAPASSVLPDPYHSTVTADPTVTTTYTVTVDDSAGTSAMGSVTVMVNGGGPMLPTACFALTWVSTTTLQLDATCSTGTSLIYDVWQAWTGDISQPADQEQTTPIFTWLQGTTQTTVRLLVTDNLGNSASATMLTPPHP